MMNMGMYGMCNTKTEPGYGAQQPASYHVAHQVGVAPTDPNNGGYPHELQPAYHQQNQHHYNSRYCEYEEYQDIVAKPSNNQFYGDIEAAAACAAAAAAVDTAIINTDNGLSYTNLDYSTPGVYHDVYNSGAGVNSATGAVAGFDPIHQTYNDNYHVTHHHSHLQTVTSDHAAAYQSNHHSVHPASTHHYHALASHHHQPSPPPHPQQQQSQQQQPQQQTSVVPTYKWMQVKRNVPKPAGKIFIPFIFSSGYNK